MSPESVTMIFTYFFKTKGGHSESGKNEERCFQMEASELNIQWGALSSRLRISCVIFIPQHTRACRLRDLTFSVISARKYLIRGFLLRDVLFLMACLCCWKPQGSAWHLLHC